MTEADWLSSTDPAEMIRWLNLAELEWTTASNAARERSQLLTERKQRLLCCAVLAASDQEKINSEEFGVFNYGEDGSSIIHVDLAINEWFTETYSYDPDNSTKCSILREIIGNPYQTVEIDPRWLDPWKSLGLANAIYKDNTFNTIDMLVLADMLEEAGCINSEILNHLRSDNKHHRGCWVIDLLLGKV